MPPSKDAATASFDEIKVQLWDILPHDKNVSDICYGLPMLDHVCAFM